MPLGYALDTRALDYVRYGLRLDSYGEYCVAVPMTLTNYVAYALSETGVELAIAQGVAETAVRNWCKSTLQEIFGNDTRKVFFDATFACV